MQIHLAPILLGKGTRLFASIDSEKSTLEPKPPVGTDYATHLTYRVVHSHRSP